MNANPAASEPLPASPVDALQSVPVLTSGVAVAPEFSALNMPVSIRSVSLAVMAVFAGLFVLYWAKAV